ncbi:hypothetical protein PRIPAC_96277, partial [Pristionchus pacificus]
CQMAPTSYPQSRIVETAYGKVQGRRLVHEGERKVDAFQGIPFAASPVGELRFRKPVPPSRWEGLKQTSEFAPRSIQHAKNPQDYDINGIPSEDSLYLNVFTPCWNAPEEGFPVMVFIHGGGYINGEAKSYGDIGICENVVTRGIVFATIQYRLGYLGFLSTGDTVCPGNFGLWDQVEALKWIQMNITAFGGNKNNVTLVGQSAGAASVDMLHLSPHSTGLFHKAILMAGSTYCRWAMHPDMAEQTRQKLKRLGVENVENSEELLKKLRGLPAKEFGVGIYTQVKEADIELETAPCFDGDFFPEPLEVLRRKATPKPFLIGVTEEEGLFPMAGRTSCAASLSDTLRDVTGECRNKEQMKDALLKRFIGDATPNDSSYLQGMAGMMSDSFFVAGSADLCKKIVEIQEEPVYLYVFEHFNPGMMGYLTPFMPLQKATHTCELFYLFKKALLVDLPLTETEMKVTNIFTTAFTNFAKFGNPNGTEAETELSVRFEPVTKKNPHLNYVITLKDAVMNDELFEGRTAAFIDIRNEFK